MELHHYEPLSRLYTHSTLAQENPRAEGSYFEQANTTKDPMPVLKVFQTAQRDTVNNEWLVVDDYRGIVWNTATKKQQAHTEIGSLPKELTIHKPNKFDDWDGTKWVKNTEAELNKQTALSRAAAQALIDTELAKPIEFDGVLFDYDKPAKRSILETIEEAQILAMNDSESTGWRLADNTTRNTSVADLKEIVKIGALRRRATNDQYTAWTETDMQAAFELTL